MLYSFFNGKWMQISKLQSQRKSLSTPEEPTALDILLITIQVCRTSFQLSDICDSDTFMAALIQYTKSHSYQWRCSGVLSWFAVWIPQVGRMLWVPFIDFCLHWNWSSNPKSVHSENTLAIVLVTFTLLWSKYHLEKKHKGKRFILVHSFRVLQSITTGNAWRSASAMVEGAWSKSFSYCHKPGGSEWPELRPRWGYYPTKTAPHSELLPPARSYLPTVPELSKTLPVRGTSNQNTKLMVYNSNPKLNIDEPVRRTKTIK